MFDAKRGAVYVPERSEGTLVSEAPLRPGHMFAVGRSVGGEYAAYKLGNKAVADTFRFESEGIVDSHATSEGTDTVWSFFISNGSQVAARKALGT